MRLSRVLKTIWALGGVAAAGGSAGAQAFRDTDWLLHRGSVERVGRNAGDTPLPPPKKAQVWVWPPTKDMPAEIVVDGGPSGFDPPLNRPVQYTEPTGQAFSLFPAPPGAGTVPLANNSTWQYVVATADRGPGAWPTTAKQPPNDTDPTKVGDYLWTNAVYNQTLHQIVDPQLHFPPDSRFFDNLDRLQKLPNVDGFLEENLAAPPYNGRNLYKVVNDELDETKNIRLAYARWSFGTAYPAGSVQGTKPVGNTALTPNQRYAVFLRFPASPTMVNGRIRPNTSFAFVRISWGANPNDPTSSRIFLVDMGRTGGQWYRIRSSRGEDRYFPYDGVNPIRVSLYNATFTEPNEAGFNTIVTADAVRLVPEALRGSIHAPASSALFPAGAPNAHTQLTYFSRDETTGPRFVTTLAQARVSPPGNFLPIPFDPTRAPHAINNPHIADQSDSITSAVFYCFEDEFGGPGGVPPAQYGRLRWRYAASSTALPRAIQDDDTNQPGFTATPGFIPVPGPAGVDESFGAGYHAAVTVDPPFTEQAIWTAALTANQRYSIYVWIPTGSVGTPLARNAHYQVATDLGAVDYFYDQFAAANVGGAKGRAGGWHLLASGIRFVNGAARLTLFNDSSVDRAAGNKVAADAVMFVGESQTRNSVVAAPLISSVTWPSGTTRQVVYFVTTGGQVWAMDALGVGGQSVHTTAYWAYPSVSNPDLARFDKNGNGIFDPEIDDPNFQPDPATGKPGIDGDLDKVRVNNQDVYRVNEATRMPRLASFESSPAYVEVNQGNTITPYIVVGNDNGRLYAFNPTGRVNTNPMVGTVGEPFPVTFATAAAEGVPGTSLREITWPTIKRDRWLKAGAPGFPNDLDNGIRPFKEDPSKLGFTASPTIPLLRNQPRNPVTGVYPSNTLIAGALEGHVYAVSLTVPAANKDRMTTQSWQFPSDRKALDPITYPGALTENGRFIFSSSGFFGGRVYGIDPNNLNQGVAQLDWVYPFTSNPPGNPNNAQDNPGEVAAFTAPVWLKSVDAALNGGKEVAFVANMDGRIFALDSTKTGGGAPTVLWQYPRQFAGEPALQDRPSDPTHASAVFLNALKPQQPFLQAAPGNPPPAILLGLDNGSLLGINARTGKQIWTFPDSNVGLVPVVGPAGFADLQFTSTGQRGADVTTANNFMYEGDEGHPVAGEVNGQMRAYGDSAIGLVTDGERRVNPEQTDVDIRLVDIWNGDNDNPPGPFDKFGLRNGGVSPFNARNQARGATQANVLIYEWGDVIKVAAWGAVLYDPFDPNCNKTLPTVSFRLTGRNQTREQQAGALIDNAYAGPQLVMIPGQPNPCLVVPWVAKTIFPLGRGSQLDSQVPGDRYTIWAEARVNSVAATAVSIPRLAIGQYNPQPNDPAVDPNQLNTPRRMALAHPLAISTRGALAGNQTGKPNLMGWTNNLPPDLLNGDVSEILANGNRRVDPATLRRSNTLLPKDLVAPVGLVGHGTSALYSAIDNAGRKVPALFIADRSNLYKIGQPLNNVRVDRREMRWGWNPNNVPEQATGNVMFPLPWEVFPNTVPNVSPDYPDIDRTRAIFRGGGIDLGVRGITLPFPDPNTSLGNKLLSPVQIDLQVDVPKYQPANVNRQYFDINDALNPGLPQGLMAPMMRESGTDPLTAGNAALRGLIAPSAGYVGRYVVYVDDNNDGRFESRTANPQLQQVAATAREEVYRTMQVGVAVPPDVRLRTEEETIDLGKLPHATGFTPAIPFGPSGVGPFSAAPFISPWDVPGQRTFFAPFTVKNEGNVNLTNVRVAKIVGDYQTNPADPALWSHLRSDQAVPLQATYNPSDPRVMFGLPNWFINSPISMVAYKYNPASGVGGNIGVVSSLDHSNTQTNFELNYNALFTRPNFWPMDRPGVLYSNPYVLAGNPLIAQGWNAGEQPRPTVHKPWVGDPSATTMSIPDVAHGDPQALLGLVTTGNAAVPGRDVRPKIGLAIPIGTPVGVYSSPVYVFEDRIPEQWRQWVYFYNGINNNGTPGDNDGLLTVPLAANDTSVLRESSANPFTLKATVTEARLTNGVTPGTYAELDNRGAGATAFGANVQPAALRDRGSGNIFLYFASNRLPNNQPLPNLPNPDMPWYLFFSQLDAARNGNAVATDPFDFSFEKVSGNRVSWWRPLDTANAPYPASLNAVKKLFPSESADVPAGTNLPAVPGLIAPNTERHASPALTQDDDPAKGQPDTWLFWQGFVYKTSGTGGQNSVLDTRTFYQRLKGGGDSTPLPAIPFSFLNDPALQKFSPKPVVLTALGGQSMAFLFWYGGPQGRTRLYYNGNASNLIDPTQWTRDEALPTPGSLQWQSDPVPVHRQFYYQDPANPANITPRDAIDLVYTGVLANQRQPETILTRYLITIQGNRARLSVARLPQADNELLVRQGSSQTWASRDLAWVYRDAITNDLVDQNGRSPITISIRRADGTVISPVNTGRPVQDAATGKLYFQSAIGGEIVIEPQGGTVTFTSVTPTRTDKLLATYIPQSMRLNVSRNDSGVVQIPAGFENDPGFVSRGHAQAPGSSTGPVAFMDRSPNPKLLATNPQVMVNPNPSAPTTRLWLIYRKSNTNVTAPSALYYKTMRLMIRLPKGLLLDVNNNGQHVIGNHIRFPDNNKAPRGPVEVDWVRGRLYFTEADEGNVVRVAFDYGRDANGNALSYPEADYRVSWGDENTVATQPADQTTSESILPIDAAVNEGQVSAFKDPYAEKVWVFWSSTRAGTTDLYYMTVSPQFYPQPGF